MSHSGDEFVVHKEDAVETLLERAAPRPVPPARDEQIVREAVHAQWQAVTGQHRSRRRVMHFAIAATILLAVAVSFNAFRVTGIAPIEVASISKSHGSIYLLGDQSELREMTDLATISAGQTIITGSDAGIGLAWGAGGSLRADQDTRIEFVSERVVYLHFGRIYFDSQSAGSAAELMIQTDHGSVTHLGTQYMTYSDKNTLIVSVREGEVTIEGHTAHEGQQLEFVGGAQPNRTNITGTEGDWEWTEASSPSINVDGKSTYEFLQWVGRETGYKVVFEGPDAEQLALGSELKGTVNTDPRSELRLRMMTVDLDYEFDADEGTINVSEIN